MDPSIGRIPKDPATRASAPRRVGPKQRKDERARDFAGELDDSEDESDEERADDLRQADRADMHVAPPSPDEAGNSLDVTG